jgi:hypothetical protein
MKNKFLLLFIFLLLFTGASRAFSFDIWQNPEMAEKYSIFAGGFVASFSYSYTQLGAIKFGLSYPSMFMDLMLPLPLPFSLGFSIDPLKKHVFGVGIRPGYHINFNDPNLDVYVLYVLNLEFVEDVSALLEWSPAIGVRRRFGIFCINLETGFMGKSLLIGFSIKLN